MSEYYGTEIDLGAAIESATGLQLDEGTLAEIMSNCSGDVGAEDPRFQNRRPGYRAGYRPQPGHGFMPGGREQHLQQQIFQLRRQLGMSKAWSSWWNRSGQRGKAPPIE